MPFLHNDCSSPLQSLHTPGTVEKDTGLSPHDQAQREQIVKLWAWRVQWLEQISGCDIRTALQAIEASDKEQSS